MVLLYVLKIAERERLEKYLGIIIQKTRLAWLKTSNK